MCSGILVEQRGSLGRVENHVISVGLHNVIQIYH